MAMGETMQSRKKRSMNWIGRSRVKWFTLAVLIYGVSGCSTYTSVTGRPAASVTEAPPRYAWITDYPHHVLSNDHTNVWVALPDSQHGFNRATRFDRAGMVTLARTTSGHTYFGPLTDELEHDPLRDDHVSGTAGEFGISHPPGYDRAAIGEAFLKIGVGKLTRKEDKPYFFRAKFPLVDPGVWSVHTNQVSATMDHVLADSGDGWAYRYTTRVELLTDRAGFLIRRRLHNTGQRRIDTDHYAHNFVVLDDYPIAADSRVTLTPPHITTAFPKLRDAAVFTEDALTMIRKLEDQTVFVRTAPRPESGATWQASVTCPQTEAKLTILQAPRPDQVVLYVDRKAMSVEPFVEIDLLPGQIKSWVTTYVLH